MAEQQLVLFRLGEDLYALPISRVREVVHYDSAASLPDAPKYIKGVINLRGSVIPLIDLAEKLCLPPQPEGERIAVIVESCGRQAAVIVDEVRDVLKISEDKMEAAPAMAYRCQSYLAGIAKAGERLILVLNSDAVLDDSSSDRIY